VDVPFLVVSASIGEEIAVSMMKAGVQDYLMKDNLLRLAPAVEREVREARARRERRQAEERLELAVTATQLGTFDFDPQTGELIWSATAKRQAGLPPEAAITYETFLNGLHADDRERVHEGSQKVLRQRDSSYSAEYRIVGIEDRIERWISAYGRPFFDAQGRAIRFVGVTLDVTEHKRLEQRFLQAQKLESIGRLAGGVAHDFNNLLTVITGYAQMVLDDINTEHPFRESMEEIIRAAGRATGMTRHLLTFSRRQVTQPKNLVLNELVRDVEKMLRRLIGEDIELVLELDPDAGVLCVDPLQMEQVILNLAVNARDAMPAGGKLQIETSRLLIDETFADSHLAAHRGSYVMLAVSDTGVGMSPHTREHLFEPFFTTKEPGKGTGLGLATVYGVVKQNEGTIWVNSELGQGSTFRILLPAVDPAPETAAVPGASGDLRGKENILVTEDEGGLREFIRRILMRQGYNVLQASNGVEALELARAHRGAVDLLLTDVVMPRMGGRELAQRFAVEHPGVPVVFMSGYADRPGLVEDLPADYLQKPFTSAALLTRLRLELRRGNVSKAD
jgi:PAS domain S-box-containing protein